MLSKNYSTIHRFLFRELTEVNPQIFYLPHVSKYTSFCTAFLFFTLVNFEIEDTFYQVQIFLAFLTHFLKFCPSRLASKLQMDREIQELHQAKITDMFPAFSTSFYCLLSSVNLD